MSKSPIAIGWAVADITPDQPVQIHGQMHERISESVHDPLTATALAIESESSEQVLMIGCDLVNIGHDIVEQLRQRVGERIPGFDPRKLLVNATHTHTGPVMMENIYPEPPDGVMTPTEYTELFLQAVADAAVTAWDNRKPAGISRALGHAVLGFNRRVAYLDGSAKMYGSSNDKDFVGAEGGMDPGVELLFTWNNEQKLTGVAVNIACPSQVVEGKRFLSADFWHPARLEIRKRLGDIAVYPMCSAAGDQSPRDLVRRNKGEPSMREVEGMNELGRRLALAVEDAYHHAQSEIEDEVVFQHTTEDLSLPMRKATADDVEAAKQRIKELNAVPPDAIRPGHTRHLQRAHNTIRRFEEQGDDPRYVADIHVIRLGDIAIATNPFELFLDYGLQMKARSNAEQTFVVQITNDRGIYLPTEKAIRGGSYSAMIIDNNVGPEGGAILVERTLELIDTMW